MSSPSLRDYAHDNSNNSGPYNRFNIHSVVPRRIRARSSLFTCRSNSWTTEDGRGLRVLRERFLDGPLLHFGLSCRKLLSFHRCDVKSGGIVPCSRYRIVIFFRRSADVSSNVIRDVTERSREDSSNSLITVARRSLIKSGSDRSDRISADRVSVHAAGDQTRVNHYGSRIHPLMQRPHTRPV